VIAGSPFVPEVLFEGSYYPLCGHHFWDDQAGASIICRELGFPHGGLLTVTRATFDRDAMPVGRCVAGDALDDCSGIPGVKMWGILEWTDGYGSCKKGNPVGVLVTCSGIEYY
jgi:hypothetical protein